MDSSRFFPQTQTPYEPDKMEKLAVIQDIADQCHVSPQDIEDAYPCTPFQATAYDITVGSPQVLYSHMTYELDDELAGKVGRLQAAIRYVHSQNPLLRTRIVNLQRCSDGASRPIQAVVREQMSWIVFDDLEAFNRKRRRRPLEFGDRLVHFAISRDSRTFVLAIHHAIYDAWSLSLVWNDIRRIFKLGQSRVAVPRPPYNKFVAFLQRPLSPSARSFWESHYRDYDGPSCAYHGSLSHTNFRRTGQLRTARPCSSGATLTARVHAAWACTMMEMFRCSDVVYASAAMGRNCAVEGALDMAGPTVCHVPFRGQGKPESLLKNFLAGMEQQSRAGLEHEHAAASVFQSMVPQHQWPAYELNVVAASQQLMPLRGMTPYIPKDQILRHMWECKMEVVAEEQCFSWELSGDTSRIPSNSIELVCRRFPQLLEQIMMFEVHESMLMKDLVQFGG